jgi:mannose-6-phosphate isomerase-like protein (cupin superfamily)
VIAAISSGSQPASASLLAATFRKPWNEQCGNPASSQRSRNQFPNPAGVNGLPNSVTRKFRWPLRVASIIRRSSGWTGNGELVAGLVLGLSPDPVQHLVGDVLLAQGLLFPTLPTLLRIALVFGVGLEHFFGKETGRRRALVRRRDRLRLPDRPGADRPAYLFESLDFPITERKIEAFRAEFPRDAPTSELHRHEGAELIYVLSGKLAVRLDDEETILGSGDAMYFDSGAPHSFRRHGRSASVAIVVVAGRSG